jgi:hypothetical protein
LSRSLCAIESYRGGERVRHYAVILLDYSSYLWPTLQPIHTASVALRRAGRGEEKQRDYLIKEIICLFCLSLFFICLCLFGSGAYHPIPWARGGWLRFRVPPVFIPGNFQEKWDQKTDVPAYIHRTPAKIRSSQHRGRHFPIEVVPRPCFLCPHYCPPGSHWRGYWPHKPRQRERS